MFGLGWWLFCLGGGGLKVGLTRNTKCSAHEGKNLRTPFVFYHPTHGPARAHPRRGQRRRGRARAHACLRLSRSHPQDRCDSSVPVRDAGARRPASRTSTGAASDESPPRLVDPTTTRLLVTPTTGIHAQTTTAISHAPGAATGNWRTDESRARRGGGNGKSGGVVNQGSAPIPRACGEHHPLPP